jgi:hypothetical protein
MGGGLLSEIDLDYGWRMDLIQSLPDRTKYMLQQFIPLTDRVFSDGAFFFRHHEVVAI